MYLETVMSPLCDNDKQFTEILEYDKDQFLDM